MACYGSNLLKRAPSGYGEHKLIGQKSIWFVVEHAATLAKDSAAANDEEDVGGKVDCGSDGDGI